MAAEVSTLPNTGKRPWAGIIVSALPVLFLLMDAAGKFARPAAVVDGTTDLGYQESVILPLGVLLLVCTVLYIMPKTSVLGAILLTGYLGGAVATHVRAGEPWFFPVIVGVLVWLGLVLRDPRLRSLVPLRKA